MELSYSLGIVPFMGTVLPGNGPRFGNVLREYRLAIGLSQEALAERAAMSVNGISALERGANQTPQRKTLELLVKALCLNAEQARILEEAAVRPSRPRSSAKRANNFPQPLTPFFGRQRLVAEVGCLVVELPLVTLTGPGGIGKTRLALKVVEESAHRFADGVRFIDLAALHEPESAFLALAAHFGVKGCGDDSLPAALAEALRSKRLLLLIDNCEHLSGAVASVTQALIARCPGVRIIVTSRQPLNIPGEQVFRVPSLETQAAVELFAESARRTAGPISFSPADTGVIARIVTRLDGIALAIELAAARIKVLTLADLERHLCERFDVLTGGSAMSLPRHQTMRATMDWSFDLLSARERQLFCSLSIFSGSFSLDAAVATCGGGQSGKWQIFEALGSLVDKSLVNSAPEGSVQRYRLLETMRAYAAERIAERGEGAALQRRHASYYAAAARDAASAFEAAESTSAWVRSLEPDLENFRAVLDYALQKRGDVAAGVRLLSDLQELWIVEGIAAEAERRAQEVLKLEVDLPNALQAALWLTISRMRQELFMHPGRMLEAACNARRLFEDSEDRRGLALAVRQQAAAHMRLGAHSQALDEFQLSLEIYKGLGDRRMAARGLGYIASLLQIQGKYDEARAMLLDVLRMARAAGDDRMIPTISMNLAETEFALGDFEAAAGRARENLSNEVLRKSCDMTATQEANLSVYLLALRQTDEARAVALASLEDANGSFIAVPLQHLAASMVYTAPAAASKILGYVDEAFKAAAFSREHTEKFSYDYLNAALRATIEKGALAKHLREGASMTEGEILTIACRALSECTPSTERSA